MWHNPSLRAMHSDLNDRYDRMAMSYRGADQDHAMRISTAMEACEAFDEALRAAMTDAPEMARAA